MKNFIYLLILLIQGFRATK